MRRSTKWLLAGSTAGTAAALAARYGLTGRAWHLRWGATDDEIKRRMRFDDLIPDANFVTNRAVTIAAPPEKIWPLLLDTSLLPGRTCIRHVEEPRSVVYAPPELEAEATWVAELVPREDGTTRLLSRNRARFPPRTSAVARYLVVDPGQFLVERRWLLRIKRMAER
jgi:hypothetical protein